MSWYAVHLGTRGRTREFTYGYHRSEVIGALFSVLLILVMAGFLVYFAVLRILNPPTDFNPPFMLGTALFGLCCNMTMAYVLWRTESDPEEDKIDDQLKKDVDEEMSQYGNSVSSDTRSLGSKNSLVKRITANLEKSEKSKVSAKKGVN